MAESTTEEGWHTADDGEKLYTKTWKPTSGLKARMVFLHGFSDHCNLFGGFFPYLAKHGIETFAFDQRGWGRSVKSPKQKGLTGPTTRVLADIASVIDRFIPERGTTGTTEVPLFLMGHSMGGAETICFAASPKYKHQNSHLRGVMLMSPWVSLHPDTKPWKSTVAIGRLASKLMPGFQLYNPVNAQHLTPDQDVVNMFKEDELVHDTGTLEGFAGALDRAADIDEGRVPLTDANAKSIWCAHGTADYICDFKGTERWFKEDCKIVDKVWKPYQGWLHRTNDQEGEKKDIFNKDVTDFILARA